MIGWHRQTGSIRIGLGVFLLLALSLFAWFSRDSLASIGTDTSARFDPRRVDLGNSHPDWLTQPSLKRSFFASYLQVVGPAFSLKDDESVRAFERRLRTSPWIEVAHAHPRLPQSMELDLTLRRPAAATVDQGGRLWLLAEDGMPLPLIQDKTVRDLQARLSPLRQARGPLALPGKERSWTGELKPFGLPLLFGGLALDVGVPPDESPRRLPAEGAQIAAMIEKQVLPRLRQRWTELPVFMGVDISNGGLRLLLAEAEYRLIFLDPLRRPVYLSWGHSPSTPYEEIPWQDKARNFRRLLEAWPGLEGIRWGDLRWSRSWQGQVEPRSVDDDRDRSKMGR